MSCKKGGFASIRHNELRDLTPQMLSKVCKDTEVEPKLKTLTGEDSYRRALNKENEARLDLRARGVWERVYIIFAKHDIFSLFFLWKT